MTFDITASTTATFIPEFQGNKDAPSTEQIKITYRNPSITTKEKILKREFAITGSGEATMNVVVDRKKILTEMIVRIDNCVYTLDGIEKKIATVDQLFSAPIFFDGLVEETYAFLNEVLNAQVNEKN